MPTEIKMPQLGESVVEGTISKWLKQPGDSVAEYEPLLEVMTDKVDTEVPAPSAGVLREIVVPEGETVRVGTVIAMLDDGNKEATASAPQAMSQPAEAAPAPTERPAAPPAPTARNGSAATFVSPVVARLVAEHGLNLSQISGTGGGGRVSKQDVMRFLAQRDADLAASAAEPAEEPALREAATSGPQPGALAAPVQPAAPAMQSAVPMAQPAEPADLPDDAELVPLSPMRRTIAEHMVRSRSIAPHVTTVMEADLTRVVLHRAANKALFDGQGVRLTFTPYFVQAVVAALQAVPVLNGTFSEAGIALNRRIHMGMAVALDEGLIVPVIRDADEKNLLGLARAVNDLSERARTRRLKAAETQGGTFTITNHGTSGSLFATPIINQPQSGILGIGAVQKRPVVVSHDGVDAITIRPMCYLSLTFDHRIADGATADGFLMAVKRYLETYVD